MRRVLLVLLILPMYLWAGEIDIWMAKGEQQLGRQEFSAAILSFSKVIELDADNADAYNKRGLAYLFSQNFEFALQDFTETLKLDSNNAGALNNRGYILMLAGQNDAAVIDFDRAIELDKEFTEAYLNRGSNYIDMMNYEAAGKDLEKAIKLNPESPSPYLELGRLYYKTKKYEQSIENYSKCLELELINPKIYYNRGNSYYKLEKYKKAIADYTKALELDSNDTEALNNRAIAYDRIGNSKAADADRNRLVKISGSENIFVPFEKLNFVSRRDSSGNISFLMPDNWYKREYHSEFSDEIVISPEKIETINSPYSIGVRMSYNKDMAQYYHVSDADSLLEFWMGSMEKNSKDYYSYQIQSRKQIARVEKKARLNKAVIQFAEDSYPLYYYEYALAKENVLFYSFFGCPVRHQEFFEPIFEKILESITIAAAKKEK